MNSFGICSLFAGKDPIRQKVVLLSHAFTRNSDFEVNISSMSALAAIFAKNTLRSKSLAPISCQVGLGFGDAESET